MDQEDSKKTDSKPIQVHCKPGQAVRINIEILVGEAEEVFGNGQQSPERRQVVVTTSEGDPVPIITGDPDPDSTPDQDTERPIGLP